MRGTPPCFVRDYTNLQNPARLPSLAVAQGPGEPAAMTDPLPTDPRLIDRFSRVLIGAVVVVADARGSLIFVRQPRGPFAGSWLLPGGGLELDFRAALALASSTSSSGQRAARVNSYCNGVRRPASFVLSSTVIVSWPAFRTN